MVFKCGVLDVGGLANRTGEERAGKKEEVLPAPQNPDLFDGGRGITQHLNLFCPGQ